MPPIWYDGGDFKLYVYTREEHRLPHVSVMVGRQRAASIAIDSGAVLAGSLPAQQLRRVRKVLQRHRVEALAAFEAGLRHELVVRLEHSSDLGDDR